METRSTVCKSIDSKELKKPAHSWSFTAPKKHMVLCDIVTDGHLRE